MAVCDVPAKIEMVDDEMARVLREMTGAERLAVANLMFQSGRRILSNQLRSEHSDWDEGRVQEVTSGRLLRGEVPSIPPLAEFVEPYRGRVNNGAEFAAKQK
jgi:hypothetical protein